MIDKAIDFLFSYNMIVLIIFNISLLAAVLWFYKTSLNGFSDNKEIFSRFFRITRFALIISDLVFLIFFVLYLFGYVEFTY